jgi:hypothetical protein
MRTQFYSVEKKHVLEAINRLKTGERTRWRAASRYFLIIDGVQYAPKAVLGLATCIANNVDEASLKPFSGGEETNSVLQKLGFEIIKSDKIT